MQKLNKMPKMCNDRGRAFSWHNGKRIYHGVWGTPETNRNYNRFIHAQTKNPDAIPMRNSGKNLAIGDVLISELAADYLAHIAPRMDKIHVQHFKRAIKFLVEIYGDMPVNEFSPKKLKTVREQMVKTGRLCRGMVNSPLTSFLVK